MRHLMTVFVLSLMVAAMVLCGCQSDAGQASGPCDYIFTEAHLAQEMTYEFVFHDEKVFVKIAKFPGDVDQRYYLVNQLPFELRQLVTHWTTRKAEMRPPYVPEGLVWSIHHVPRTSPESGEMRGFKSGNKDLLKFRETIVAHVAIEENEIPSPPEWATEILENEKIMIQASIDALHRKLDKSSRSNGP